jgi:parallel beta-helix repeat protein
VVEKLIDEGVSPDEIDLAEIQASDDFTNLVEKVTEVLEEQGDVTEDPEVTEVVDNTAEEIINPPAPAPTPTATPITAVSIDGNPVIGITLTTTVTPSRARVTYQWQRAGEENGTYTDIPGATSSTYTLIADDLDKYIQVVVTGTGNYTGTITSDPVGPVARVLNVTQKKGYDTITGAVREAVEGDTIIVGTGTYAAPGETFPITVNTANLTIKGAQFGVDPTTAGARTNEAQETVIDSTGTGSGVNVFNITASGVTIDGFTVKNNTAGRAAIVVGNPNSAHTSITNENITISNNILTANKRGLGIYDNRESLVKNNRIANNNDIAIYIAAVESSTVIDGNLITGNYCPSITFGAITVTYGANYPLTQPTITDNYITDNGLQGIMVYGASAIIQGNIITGHSNTGIRFYYQPEGAPTAIVEGSNIVTENGDGTGDTPSGIALCQAAPIVRGNNISVNNPCGILLVNTHNPYGGDGNVDALIENNTISNNTADGIYFYNRYGSSPTITGNTITGNGNDGILLDVPHSGPGNVCHPLIHFNSITGNTNYGVENKDTAVTINAECNWWGNPNGPSHDSVIAGDAVSGDVDFNPWCTVLCSGGSCTGCTLTQ